MTYYIKESIKRKKNTKVSPALAVSFSGCFLSDSLTHLARIQPVQALVDPLLHVQPPLQLLPVVLHGNPSVSLGDITSLIGGQLHIWWMNVVIFPKRRPGSVGCHLCSGLVRLVSLLFHAHEERAAVGGDDSADCSQRFYSDTATHFCVLNLSLLWHKSSEL